MEARVGVPRPVDQADRVLVHGHGTEGAKARQWAEAILGRGIHNGQELDLDTLIDRPCRVVITHKEGDDGEPFDVVNNILPATSNDDDDDLDPSDFLDPTEDAPA